MHVFLHSGATAVLIDYFKSSICRKLDIIIKNVGANDWTKGVNTIRKVKVVETIKGLSLDKTMKIGFLKLVFVIFIYFTRRKHFIIMKSALYFTKK